MIFNLKNGTIKEGSKPQSMEITAQEMESKKMQSITVAANSPEGYVKWNTHIAVPLDFQVEVKLKNWDKLKLSWRRRFRAKIKMDEVVFIFNLKITFQVLFRLYLSCRNSFIESFSTWVQLEFNLNLGCHHSQRTNHQRECDGAIGLDHFFGSQCRLPRSSRRMAPNARKMRNYSGRFRRNFKLRVENKRRNISDGNFSNPIQIN